MTRLTTPYNFVPLSDKVYFPEWANEGELSHDAPLKEGWCGTLRIRITASTPLLVTGTQTGAERHPVKVMDHYAIPGSSLRGMLRNVLEIATFGKFGRAVNDRAMSIRDLTPSGDVYRRRINAKTVHAGWLKIGAGDVDAFATVTPTDWEYEEKSKVDNWWNKRIHQDKKDPYKLGVLILNASTGKQETWRYVRTGEVVGKREPVRNFVCEA